MWITKFQVNNYKSYLNTPEIELHRGINLVIGQNNAGKTAILEVLNGSIENKPFLNESSIPRPSSSIKFPQWAAQLQLCVRREILDNLIEDKVSNNSYIFRNSLKGLKDLSFSEEKGWLKTTYLSESFPLEEKVDFLEIEGLGNDLKNSIEQDLLVNVRVPNKESQILNIYEEFQKTNDNIKAIELHVNSKQISFKERISSAFEISELILREFYEGRVFKFDIHRMISAKGNNQKNKQLLPNCNNLADVINSLQAEFLKFEEYKNTLKSIFPNIKNISIDNNAGIPEIRVWLPQTKRLDLTVSLNECGTGIGQVMAILYVIIQSENSKVIIIDEPNSFLHPSASRKLMEIIKQYNQHQYIIATHSPELITSAEADNILLLALNEEGQTQIKRIDKAEREEMQEVLLEIGSKLSDVFGYEQVLWVEGPTEEIGFKLIVEKLLKKHTTTRPILKVHETGSFEKKHIETTISIYERLVNGNALIPPALAFIFDRENRSQKERDDLKRLGKGKIQFLDRRMYENYLLNSSAITSILNHYSEEHSWDKTFNINEIEAFFEKNKSKKEYWDNKKPDNNQLKNWKQEIHAANILHDLYAIFSENNSLDYKSNKVKHSKELTEWIIENAPEELKELTTLLSEFYRS